MNNTTLPPSRDLPPRRLAEIRDAVLSAASPHPARRWVAPLVTAAAALAALGLVAWFVPWGGAAPAGGQPVRTPPVNTSSVSTPPEPANTTMSATQAVPGVDPTEVAAIEEGCGESAIPTAKATLRQVITDQAGRLALLIAVDETARTESMVVCELEAPPTGYNAGFAGMSPYTGVVSLDFAMSSAGGDMKGGKPEYAGRLGSDEAAGRVSSKVAKVIFTQGDESVDAVIADGTYLARIVHPSDWEIPANHPVPVVRAYDKNGTLLGEIGP